MDFSPLEVSIDLKGFFIKYNSIIPESQSGNYGAIFRFLLILKLSFRLRLVAEIENIWNLQMVIGLIYIYIYELAIEVIHFIWSNLMSYSNPRR